MAPGSSGRAAGIALLTALLLGVSGCCTGHLIESGRTRESLVEYQSAALEGGMLRIDYTVERVDARGQLVGEAERSALIALADLRAEPEHPVDAFPLQHVAVDDHAASGRPLRIVHAEAGPELASATTSAGPSLLVELDESDGRHAGFHLCPEAAAACPTHFHSAALTRYGLRWWIYPLVPISAATDVAILPLQVVTLPPLLLLSD